MSIEQPEPFAPCVAIARAMVGYAQTWWFAGGWAIDLFLECVTREHEDVEIGVFRRDQDLLRQYLRDWKLLRCSDSKWSPWEKNIRVERPDFQLKAEHATLKPREFDIFLDDDDEATGRWICRRHASITLPRDGFTIAVEIGGITVRALRPEIQLFYKAKYHRAKDERDFAATLPSLSSSQRKWLHEALSDCYGNDPWLARL